MGRIEEKIRNKYRSTDYEKYERLMHAWWWLKGKFEFIPKAIASTYLVWRFPFLKFSTDKNKVFHSSCWYWMMANYCGTTMEKLPGWRKAFGIQLCKELKDALKRHGQLGAYTITDIKEKWGALNIYDDGAPSEVHDILAKYEYISSRTCVKCGRRAKYVTNGYVLPFCEDCIGDRGDFMGKEEFYKKDLDWYGWTKLSSDNGVDGGGETETLQ